MWGVPLKFVYKRWLLWCCVAAALTARSVCGRWDSLAPCVTPQQWDSSVPQSTLRHSPLRQRFAISTNFPSFPFRFIFRFISVVVQRLKITNIETRSIWKMLGPFATASHRRGCYCRVARRLHIDVHDDDDDNDNAWQRGPLWPHGMGPMTFRFNDDYNYSTVWYTGAKCSKWQQGHLS